MAVFLVKRFSNRAGEANYLVNRDRNGKWDRTLAGISDNSVCVTDEWKPLCPLW